MLPGFGIFYISDNIGIGGFLTEKTSAEKTGAEKTGAEKKGKKNGKYFSCHMRCFTIKISRHSYFILCS